MLLSVSLYFVERGWCVLSTMLLPLYLYLCWERVMCSIHSVVASVYLLREHTEYMKIVCSIHVPLYLCLENVIMNIYQGRFFDPPSTQLALHNSTPNHVGGKEAICVNSIQINLTFLTHASSSSIFVLPLLGSLLSLFQILGDKNVLQLWT